MPRAVAARPFYGWYVVAALCVTETATWGIVYHYDSQAERTGITTLLNELREAGIHFTDLHTKQSSLEEIFINVVREGR